MDTQRAAGFLTAALVLSAACLAACDRSDRLYGDARHDAGPRAADAPEVPFLVDQAFRNSCESCARRECGEQQRICAADPDCRQMLECLSRCDNWSSCGYDCELQPSVVKDAPHVEASQRYIDFRDCAFGDACAVSCNVGTNFGCAGAHPPSVPAAVDGLAELRMVLAISSNASIGVAGLRVRSCLNAHETCRPGPLDSTEGVRSDAYGRAVLPVGVLGEDGIFDVVDNHLEIDAPDNRHVHPVIVHSSAPFQSPLQVNWIFSALAVQLFFDRFDHSAVTTNLQLGLLHVSLWDCTAMRAPKHAVLTVEGLEEGPLSPMPSTMHPDAQWWLGNLPTGQLELEASIGGRVVARDEVWVRQGTVTVAHLVPGDRQEIPAAAP